jgi:hypothetical protein
MSTAYFVKGETIPFREIEELATKIKGLNVQIEDPLKSDSFLDAGVRPTKDHYRFRVSFEGNYLWGYVDEDRIGCFVKYGLNDPFSIVDIIQYQTERYLIDEHTHTEMVNVFEDFEEETEER